MSTAYDHLKRWPKVFDYTLMPKEDVPDCNLCGPTLKPYVLAERDRYGLPVRSLQCPVCGLVWISPRMKAEGYQRFYEHGIYRDLVSQHTGRRVPLSEVESDQHRYAGFLKGLNLAGATCLDVGGSTGIVGRTYYDHVTVLDPASAEVGRTLGQEAIISSVEDWEPNGRVWDGILVCRTIDHLLNIKESLRKFRAALAPGGVLWIDAVQWQVTASLAGSVEGAMKVDHPFALMEGNFLRFLKGAGFKPETRLAFSRSVGYLCR